MATIHWLGAGLSSGPGIRKLAQGTTQLVLWNRTLAKADAVVSNMSPPPLTRELEMAALSKAVLPGDILVSMLPGTMHCTIAKLALDKGAHFVSSSYIADDMRELHADACKSKLCLVNEVGLDPGLDHLMAHSLVYDYRNSAQFDPSNRLAFRSYCGGFPKVPNDFRYKFSWSPLGVLKALKSPARCISNGQEKTIRRPWEAISNYKALLPAGTENFEAYPNRDSLPFLADYHFDPEWQVDEFVRGTLRLPGWSNAWESIFAEIDSLEGPAGDSRLEEMSDHLWQTQSYEDDEQDRVVLCVELRATCEGKSVWHKAYSVDSCGNKDGSAMARLVSYTVSLAVESILAGSIDPGVSAAPSEPELVSLWLSSLSDLGESIYSRDCLSA